MRILPISILAISGLCLATVSASAFSMKAQWPQVAACANTAPGFTLAKVPANTTKISFKMVDLDLPTFQHGGGELAYSGKNTLASGEAFGGFLSTYRGPCPPVGQSHRYEWTAQALDASGKVLGVAKSVLPFKR
jgi:phosphatidylethanolamine-binding protein (PEBP) family uncharacterized protein